MVHARRNLLHIDRLALFILYWHHLGREANLAIGKSHLVAIGQAKAEDDAFF